MIIGNSRENNQTHIYYWDEESQEISEQVETASVVIGYAKKEEEARAFIES